MTKIQTNNLELYIKGDKENSLIDSAMYYIDTRLGNQCECQGDGGCVIDYGIYFGTSDEREPLFCPRHYFTGGGYEIKSTRNKWSYCNHYVVDEKGLCLRCGYNTKNLTNKQLKTYEKI